MFDLILYEPEIPPNTGNVIRLCANVGASLHLVHPLGFEMEARQLRRAGLDYHEWVRVEVHATLAHYLETAAPARLLTFSRASSTSFSLASGMTMSSLPNEMPPLQACSKPRPITRSANMTVSF